MILTIINGLFQLYSLAIVVYCLMSWFPGALQTKFGILLDRVVSPFLKLFDFIPPIFNIDFSPIIALIVLQFVNMGLDGILGFVLGV